MSWITMDTKLPDHPKMAALPNDTARYGWILTLLEAKEQKAPGTFATANHFRHVLGKYGRYLQDYIKVGLLDEVGGHIEVHDWSEYQRDRTATERQRRHRDKDVTVTDENRDTSVPRAGASAVALAVPVVVPTEERVQREKPDPIDAFHSRTGEVPGPKMRSWLLDLAREFTEPRLVSMIGSTPLSGSVRDYLVEVKNRLRLEDYAAEREKAAPKPKPPPKSEAELRSEREAIDKEVRRLMQPGALA
jgi:hypothetical protein